MKTFILIFGLAIGTVFSAGAQTNFYANVTNLWYKGQKSNVLAIANARLAQNTNDIAGLILKAEYNLEFYDVMNISNSFIRVIQVGDSITTTNFYKRYQIMRQDMLWTLRDLAENPITAQEIQEERPKAFINHKSLPASLIEALQKDGYFNQGE
ncbi:MAG: hypothetical protein PHO37_17115 [Kiritimatiellae bacterium]|nr:hypothetical protein [Kiritimatiellia bacterium]